MKLEMELLVMRMDLEGSRVGNREKGLKRVSCENERRCGTMW